MSIFRWPFRVLGKLRRRALLGCLLEELEAWEIEGRNLLARAIELSDPEDDLHAECRRVLDLLSGP
jgi:hypothetical protein